MTMNPRLKPGDLALKSAPGSDGARHWIATGRCAVCTLAVSEEQPAVVYRPVTRVTTGEPIGLMHWVCAPVAAKLAPEDAPRVIRFNVRASD